MGKINEKQLLANMNIIENTMVKYEKFNEMEKTAPSKDDINGLKESIKNYVKDTASFKPSEIEKLQNKLDMYLKKIYTAETAINKDLDSICKNIDSCFQKLDSTAWKDENVIKIHSLAVTIIDEIFEGSKKLLSSKAFDNLMRKSDFLKFRVMMGNFSNVISNAPEIGYFYYYGDPRKNIGAGQISDRCLGIFKGYIPELAAVSIIYC